VVLPFELYCRGCGCRLIAAAEHNALEALPLIQDEATIDSWLSQKVRGLTNCPNCGRVITTDLLVRADVMFAEWNDSADQKARTVIFYV
jgi:hypothetical protein